MNLDLTWRLIKGGGRKGMLGTWLTFGAVAVATALLLFAVAANFAFQARAERGAWRNPVPATTGAVAVEAQRFDFVRDQKITVIDLAALKGADPEAPPGLPRFPAPGEVWLSPALAELADELPAAELAARYPKRAGVIGDEALVYPGELVAVFGQAPDAPAMTAPRLDDWVMSRPPVKVASLAGEPSEDAVAYQWLSAIAGVLMVVPLLVFGGAAARLTVARRDRRLAALRLVGATPGQVVAMTVTEAVLVALAGALTGAVVYALSVPLLTRIEMQGGPWFAGDLLPGPLLLAGALVAVPLLVGLSAVAGLRRVVVSPLGVAKRETPPAMRIFRVLALFAALAVFPLLSRETSVTLIAIALALAFLCLNLAGPWVVGVIGRIAAKSARSGRAAGRPAARGRPALGLAHGERRGADRVRGGLPRPAQPWGVRRGHRAAPAQRERHRGQARRGGRAGPRPAQGGRRDRHRRAAGQGRGRRAGQLGRRRDPGQGAYRAGRPRARPHAHHPGGGPALRLGDPRRHQGRDDRGAVGVVPGGHHQLGDHRHVVGAGPAADVRAAAPGRHAAGGARQGA
ncbi:FtsX-like permease family protein [Nonomuraea salmonea]|uniref:FtsX-like permease family protein n=1 Tax=Nonomuraea salmonea TaxID=46181 RepID=UPI002FEB0BE8